MSHAGGTAGSSGTDAALGAGEPERSLSTLFQVWGARGSRNATGSRFGNSTSCYSLAVGADLFIFDAGSGLLPLSAALATDERLGSIERVHLFITHAHWDHWEGVRDAEWMWRKGNGLDLTVIAPKEALDTLRAVCQPPAFVSLETLAVGTLGSLSFVELEAGRSCELPGATLDPVSLHHYSGIAPNRRYLDTLGYRLRIDGGPILAYLCDHEPTADTVEMEDDALKSVDLAIVDASFGDIAEHAFGHGSVESSAELARRFPGVQVLAAHHGPLRSDPQIEDAARRHGAGLDNFTVAVEGSSLRWDAQASAFVAD